MVFITHLVMPLVRLSGLQSAMMFPIWFVLLAFEIVIVVLFLFLRRLSLVLLALLFLVVVVMLLVFALLVYRKMVSVFSNVVQENLQIMGFVVTLVRLRVLVILGRIISLLRHVLIIVRLGGVLLVGAYLILEYILVNFVGLIILIRRLRLMAVVIRAMKNLMVNVF